MDCLLSNSEDPKNVGCSVLAEFIEICKQRSELKFCDSLHSTGTGLSSVLWRRTLPSHTALQKVIAVLMMEVQWQRGEKFFVDLCKHESLSSALSRKRTDSSTFSAAQRSENLYRL